jgi:hypothetical protein
MEEIMNVKTGPTYWVHVYIAGPIDTIQHLCQKWVYENPQCVTVTPTQFVYTGGAETGACIGFVNYPRFPEKPGSIWGLAVRLAGHLIEELGQHSALIQAPDKTIWITRRKESD